MKTNNILIVIAVIAVVVSVLGMGITYNYVIAFQQWITGYATDQGTVNLTVETSALINFTTANVSFASGRVDDGKNIAWMVSSNGSITDGNWTAPGNDFVIENIGNVNVTLELKAGKTNATFIGGSAGGGPVYYWNITNSEASSCNGSATFNMSGDTNPREDIFEDVNTTGDGEKICDEFNFQDSYDEIKIAVLLGVPSDSTTGDLSDAFTLTFSAA
tara:strand:+ start:348 stop:998 length:651 start_codon:yes stop_codon:yes gene_type:complete